MSELGGLWKHQNNSACAEKRRNLPNLEVGHYAKEAEIEHYAKEAEIGHYAKEAEKEESTASVWLRLDDVRPAFNFLFLKKKQHKNLDQLLNF